MEKEMSEIRVAYEAPQVEVIEVAVERGFAASGNITPLPTNDWE